jgi:pilus assembly protein CpaF
MSGKTSLEIRRPGKAPSVFEIEPGTYTIGSDEECSLRLHHARVEPRHAILTVRPDGVWIEVLADEAPTTIDGVPIRGRASLGRGRVLGIGAFELLVEPPAHPAPEQPANEPPPPGSPPAPATPAAASPAPPPAPAAASSARADVGTLSVTEQKRAIARQIHKQLIARLDIKRLTASQTDPADLRQRALEALRAIVQEAAPGLPAGMDPQEIVRDVYNEALGLGPIEEFMDDPDITEVMVNGHRMVYVEKGGKLLLTDKTFMNDASVLAIIERIVAPIGRRIDESQPYVDARLPDGSRVNAIISPLSLTGPCLTIRKFSKDPFRDRDLVSFGTWTTQMAELCRVCVLLRKNIVVSGGTGSGKTTLLNVLSSYLPESERIVTIEDAAELRLDQEHLVRLESRPPNIEGRGAVTIRDLVRNALRMRPDRIIVGECRGAESLDMLQAMNTGHDGSLTTVHANSPRDVVSRLETMVLMSGMDLPLRAIREQIASAVDVIVHIARFSDGTRKVTRITEIVGLEQDSITMQDIFQYDQTGLDGRGRVLGAFRPSGAVPTFLDQIASRGLTIDRDMFDPLRRKENGP